MQDPASRWGWGVETQGKQMSVVMRTQHRKLNYYCVWY